MKTTIFSFPAFLISLLIGTVVAGLVEELIDRLNQFEMPSVSAVEVERMGAATIEHTEPPRFDPRIDYANGLNVKLLQTGAYHSDEVPYKTGERWLGLFRVGSIYELRWTTIRNDRNVEDDLMDREIFTSDPHPSIFLLRGATDLTPGPVATVFDAETDGEFSFLEPRSFGLKGSFWKLWINNLSKDGFPQAGSALMVQASGKDPIVLRDIFTPCDDCGWRVLWAGDLDRDSNLDFLIDLSRHYNSYEPVLFTSGPGCDMCVLAAFHGVGC